MSNRLTYDLIDDGAAPAIRCRVCGHKSYNENDISQRYCGYCHMFHTQIAAAVALNLVESPDRPARPQASKAYPLSPRSDQS